MYTHIHVCKCKCSQIILGETEDSRLSILCLNDVSSESYILIANIELLCRVDRGNRLMATSVTCNMLTTTFFNVSFANLIK